MDRKTLLIVVALVVAYFLFFRKPSVAVSKTVVKPVSPSPAMPTTTSQVAVAAAIKAAPQAITALGNLFSNSSDDDDSAASSDDLSDDDDDDD